MGLNYNTGNRGTTGSVKQISLKDGTLPSDVSGNQIFFIKEGGTINSSTIAAGTFMTAIKTVRGEASLSDFILSTGSSSSADIGPVRTLTGTPALAEDLGSFTNTVIPSGSTIKEALEAVGAGLDENGERVKVADNAAMAASTAPNGTTFFVVDDGATGNWGMYQRISGVDEKLFGQDSFSAGGTTLTDAQAKDETNTLPGMVMGGKQLYDVINHHRGLKDSTPTTSSTNSVESGGIKTVIDAESATRASADNTNATAISTETTNRVNADTTLQTNIDDEAAARAAADSTNSTAISTETTNRSNADTTLQTNIDTESSTRETADTTLQTNIDTEATTRGNADITLQGNIDAIIEANASIDTHSDVDTTGKADDEVLTYNSTSGNWESKVSASGVTDHGALTGLIDDDHINYHNDARGDARYYTQGQIDTSLSGKSDTGHTHTASEVTDFDTEVSNNADVVANTAKVTNATHTGEVTGDGVLAADKSIISNKTLVTADGTDHVLVGDASDADNLKKVLVSDFLSGGSGESVEKDFIQTAHGLSVGDWVKKITGGYAKAQADVAANAEVVGVVSAVTGANNFTLTQSGYVSGLAGLTENSVYFLDETTAGAMTETEPSIAGEISKPIFVAISYSRSCGCVV